MIATDLPPSAGAAMPQLTVPDMVFVDHRIVAPGDPRLVWPAGTALTLERAEGEVIVHSDRPIGAEAVALFQSQVGAAIGDLRWNDVSLVLRPATGWAMDARIIGAALIVAFQPAADAVVTAPVSVGDPKADVARALVEADLAAGYPGRGREQAASLVARDPEDQRAARLLADARMLDGDVAGAARGYRAVGATDKAARRAMAAAGGTASVGLVAREGGDLAQLEASIRAEVPLDDRVSMGASVRHLVSRVEAGGGQVSETASVIDAGLAVALSDAARLQLLAASALDDGVTGGGVKLTYGPAEAQFRVALTRHMPDYVTPAQVLAGGYLSRAALGGVYRLSSGLVVQGDVGVNRYGLAGRRGASDSVTLAGGLDYLIRRRYPLFGLSYRVEAEYVQHMRSDATGIPLIPLADRENHTVQAMLGEALGEVQLTGMAGWTVDRFGGDGPNASLGMTVPIGLWWKVEASGGLTSISRPGFSGQQLFARALVTRSLGAPR